MASKTDSAKKTKGDVSDYAGFLAVKYYNNLDCLKGEVEPTEVYCSLQELRETKIKYLSLLSRGNYARRYSMDINNKFNEIFKIKNYCRDFIKTKPVLLEIKKLVLDIPVRYAVSINGQVETFIDDCENPRPAEIGTGN